MSAIKPLPFIILALLCASLGLSGCSAPPNSPTQSQQNAVPAGATALMTNYLNAINASDWESVIAMMSDAPDFQWSEANRPGYRNKTEYAKAMRSLKDLADASRMKLTDIQYTVLSPTRVDVTCRYANDLRLKNGKWMSLTGSFKGAVTQENGRWKFASGATNGDGPPQISDNPPVR